jgi:hypothetical protein
MIEVCRRPRLVEDELCKMALSQKKTASGTDHTLFRPARSNQCKQCKLIKSFSKKKVRRGSKALSKRRHTTVSQDSFLRFLDLCRYSFLSPQDIGNANLICAGIDLSDI